VPKMSGLKVFVFDLDDTLYPEIQYVWSGFRAVSRMLVANKKVEDKLFNDMQDLFSTTASTASRQCCAFMLESL